MSPLTQGGTTVAFDTV